MNFIKTFSILLFFIIIIFTSCLTAQKTITNNIEWIEKKAVTLYDKHELIFNNDSSYVIVLTSNKTEFNPNFKLKFSVFSLLDKKKIVQREMNNTTISWNSNTEIVAKTQLGFVDKKTGISTKTIVIDVNKN